MSPKFCSGAFWRTSTGQEVDFLAGDKDLAMEVKASRRVHDSDTRSLRALQEDGPLGHAVVVSLESEPRTLEGGIEVLPWPHVLERLWGGDFPI